MINRESIKLHFQCKIKPQTQLVSDTSIYYFYPMGAFMNDMCTLDA